MADPRFNVKPCPPQYASRYEAEIGRQTGKSRDFFDAMGKVGDLEVLNDIGAGKIGEGLRVLAGISNTVRTGCGALPTSIGGVVGSVLDEASSIMSNGVNWVLESLGLDMTMIEAVEAFNPGVANQALGQAKQIYEMVRNGKLDITDIPHVFQDLQNLERLARGIYTPSSGGDRQTMTSRCEASPYAMDLIARHGKYQFLFVVEFVFNAPFTELGTLTFPFVIKRSTRPNIRYNMTDANYYNFRTKVITKTEFEDMTMTFHDDQQNEMMRFYNAYLKATSPIANIETPTEFAQAEEMGMDFGASGGSTGAMKGSTGQIETNYYTASSGPLMSGAKTILNSINIYHVYGNGNSMNIFTFHRPRITNMNLNDLDMVGSELNDATCSFNYDSLFIQTDVDLTTQNSPMIEQARANPVYPLRYNDSARSVQASNENMRNPSNPQGIPDSCSPMIDNKSNVGTPGIVADVANAVAKATGPTISQSLGALANLGGLF